MNLRFRARGLQSAAKDPHFPVVTRGGLVTLIILIEGFGTHRTVRIIRNHKE